METKTWQDTVMPVEEMVRIIRPHQLDFPPTVKAEHKALVNQQAEVAFKVGQKAGRVGVMKWIEKRDCPYTIFDDKVHVFKITDVEWQFKLKEWEIEDGQANALHNVGG